MTAIAETPGAQTLDRRIDVPHTLSENEVRFFVENGYLVVEGLVNLKEVEELRQDAVAVARGVYPCESIPPVGPEISDCEVLENILCIHQPHYISPVMEKYARHPGICGVLSQITA